MAKTSNSLFQQASGTISNDIVIKRYYDKVVLSKKPDMSNRVLSEKQKDWNGRLALATAYARYLCRTEEGKVKEKIRLKLPAHKAVFNALVKEHLLKYKNMTLDEAGEETAKIAE